MVRVLSIVLAAFLSGCLEAGPPVAIDLCPSPSAEPADLAVMDSATSWQAIVFIFRSDESLDVAHERILSADGAGSGPLLSLSSALPPLTPMRLTVVGYQTVGSESTIVALASSLPLEVVGGEELCLCVAPPDQYGDDCYNRSCSSTGEGSCSF